MRGHIREGKDFFKEDVPKCDYIISNPPYSMIAEVLERLEAVGRPYAMLVNGDGIFGAKRRFDLFEGKQPQIMFLYPRVQYYHDGAVRANNSFNSVYLCKDVLPRQIVLQRTK